jgi:hypothetical protein
MPILLNIYYEKNFQTNSTQAPISALRTSVQHVISKALKANKCVKRLSPAVSSFRGESTLLLLIAQRPLSCFNLPHQQNIR